MFVALAWSVKVASTRLVSAEAMVSSLLTVHVVYTELIKCPDFSSHLFDSQNVDRKEHFMAVVEDQSVFIRNV